MERTKRYSKIPDAINLTAEDNYTKVSNEILKNPDLSFKAKGILALLLSNKRGWHSYFESICERSSDGPTAVRSGLLELEQCGLLVKIKYRDKKSKTYKGTLWGYTDAPGEAIVEKALDLLACHGYEPDFSGGGETCPTNRFSSLGKPYIGKPYIGKSSPNKTNKIRSNKEDQETSSLVQSKLELNVPISKYDKVTPSMFHQFWNLYPRKTDKGKAISAWEKLCRKSDTVRPSWEVIENAILAQTKTQRWQEKKFIPHPSTWINNQRWLDDPSEMNGWEDDSTGPDLPSVEEIIKHHFKNKDTQIIFTNSCYNPAKRLLNVVEDSYCRELASILVDLYFDIEEGQGKASKEVKRLLPGPFELITNYIAWIKDNDWITNYNLKMFSMSYNLFSRFRRDEASKDNMERDPISGRSYMNK